MTSKEIEKAVYFLTEQVCCLKQAHGKETEDTIICEKAVRFLVKGDPKLLQPFKERTAAVKYDPNADYDTEQYEGKDADICATVANLFRLSKDPGTPAENGELLNHGARMIAEFYGMEDALPETA